VPPLLVLLIVADSSAPRWVTVAARESLAVTATGAGTPVVLVPGLFGSAYAYRHVAPQLAAAGYRAVIIEPLAVGGSSRPERADYSLTAQADRIAGVLDTLALGPAIVVAHAVAASIAYRVAYRRPDLVRGVVALEGGPVEAAATPAFRRALRLAPWIKLFGGVGRIRRAIRQQLVSVSRDTSWVSDEVVVGYTAAAAADLDGTLRSYLAMAQAREPERLRDHLARIACPVRLVVGGWPHRVGPTPADVALLGAGLRRFAVDSVDGAGHFVHEERPEAVVAAVRRILTGA
jgi:pimeloyl-ACP methyl ester carboxylesterase